MRVQRCESISELCAADTGNCFLGASAAEGFDVVVSDLKYGSTHNLEVTGPSLLKIGFFQRAVIDVTFEKRQMVRSANSECIFTIHPNGMPKLQKNLAGTEVRSILLVMTPEFLCQTLTHSAARLPLAIRRFVDGDRRDFHIGQFSINGLLSRCVSDMIDIKLSDPLAHILIEAKSLELLYRFLEVVSEAGGDTMPALRFADAARLNEVRALLDDSYQSPPDLGSLGKVAGMSRSKLTIAFKRQFGATIGEYCLDLRMRKARSLLRETDQPISVIGFQVGYEHQSSFSSAYRSYFGRNPKQERH